MQQANQEQKEAIKKLEEAIAQLDEKVDQLENQQNEKTLAKIEDRLDQALKTQKRVTIETGIIQNKRQAEGSSEVDRVTRSQLVDLSGEEGKLAEEMDSIRKALLDEGSTIVFPSVLGDISTDLSDIQTRLANSDSGTVTQGIQGSVEEMLEELLRSIRDKLADRKKKDLEKKKQQQQGGG